MSDFCFSANIWMLSLFSISILPMSDVRPIKSPVVTSLDQVKSHEEGAKKFEKDRRIEVRQDDDRNLAAALANPGDTTERSHGAQKRPASASPPLSPLPSSPHSVGVSAAKPPKKRMDTGTSNRGLLLNDESLESEASEEDNHDLGKDDSGANEDKGRKADSASMAKSKSELASTKGSYGALMQRFDAGKRAGETKKEQSESGGIKISLGAALAARGAAKSTRPQLQAFERPSDEEQAMSASLAASNAKKVADSKAGSLARSGTKWPVGQLFEDDVTRSSLVQKSEEISKNFITNAVQKNNIRNHFRGNENNKRDMICKNHGREFIGCGIIPGYGRPIRNEAEYAHFACWYLDNHVKLGAVVIRYRVDGGKPRVAYYHSQADILLVLVDRNGKESVFDDFVTFFRPELDRMDANKPFLSFSGVGDSYIAEHIKPFEISL